MNEDELKEMFARLDVAARLHSLPETLPLETKEAAIFLRCSDKTLEALRMKGGGPRYIQGSGVNGKCHYHKADLLAWQENNKVSSTTEAAVRGGMLFMSSLHDAVATEAFWIDDHGDVIGMVEETRLGVVLERLGVVDIEWLPVIDAVSRPWSEVDAHKNLANRVNDVLKHQLGRVLAGVESTEIARAIEGK